MGLHSCKTRGSALVQHQMLNPSIQTDPTQPKQCSLSSSLMTIGWVFYYFVVVVVFFWCYYFFLLSSVYRAVTTAVLPPSNSLFKSVKNEVERLWRDTPAQKQSKSVSTVWLGGESRLLGQD